MDKEVLISLAMTRLERAIELFEEAEELLHKSKYKSANNRAFYSIEKCMKALLAVKNRDAQTHNGCLKQFHIYFIKEGDEGFDNTDYKKLSEASRIRNSSDYDDFYIASKEECVRQVTLAKEMIEKTNKYLDGIK